MVNRVAEAQRNIDKAHDAIYDLGQYLGELEADAITDRELLDQANEEIERLKEELADRIKLD